jgi:hypothetical protein
MNKTTSVVTTAAPALTHFVEWDRINKRGLSFAIPCETWVAYAQIAAGDPPTCPACRADCERTASDVFGDE